MTNNSSNVEIDINWLVTWLKRLIITMDIIVGMDSLPGEGN
jgi:hypothetical protein